MFKHVGTTNRITILQHLTTTINHGRIATPSEFSPALKLPLIQRQHEELWDSWMARVSVNREDFGSDRFKFKHLWYVQLTDTTAAWWLHCFQINPHVLKFSAFFQMIEILEIPRDPHSLHFPSKRCTSYLDSPLEFAGASQA